MSRTKEETTMKKTLIIAGLLTVLLAGCSTAPTTDTSSTTSTQTETTQTETTSDTAPVAETKQEDNNVPTEYKSALRSAKNYSDMMHMSKQGIYDQLTSEYGDKFTAEAAQYAVDNLDVDYKENALKSAETYQETMAMSPAAIKDQLTSEYGEKFTEEEAQYAIDNLK